MSMTSSLALLKYYTICSHPKPVKEDVFMSIKNKALQNKAHFIRWRNKHFFDSPESLHLLLKLNTYKSKSLNSLHIKVKVQTMNRFDVFSDDLTVEQQRTTLEPH
jgi:hypothetical protein